MQRWEYCAVVGLRKLWQHRILEPYYPAIWNFTISGIGVTDIDGKKADRVAKTSAQLGEEGWEAVGAFPDTADLPEQQKAFGILFKRPKQEQPAGTN